MTQPPMPPPHPGADPQRPQASQPSGPSAPTGPAGQAAGTASRSRRPLILGIVVVAIGALLLAVIGAGTVTYLMLNRQAQQPPGATAPPAPTYRAPTPMTEVDTDWYTFSYPEHWQTQDSTDLVDMHFALSTLDVNENTTMIVMDFLRLKPLEAACEDLAAENEHYAPMPDVLIDGRTALHYQYTEADPHTEGEDRVQDLWCAARGENIVVVLGRTSGPEAIDAGISEVQKVLDSWQWREEE